MKQAIAIFTPNKDTFTNPTLVELLNKLIERNVRVLLFTPARTNTLNFNIEQHIIPLPFIRKPGSLREAYWVFRTYLRVLLKLKVSGIKQLIAIDPMGLIMAGRIKSILTGLKINYMSFEIFFKDELQDNPDYLLMKSKEVKYSRALNSVIIQDDVRQKLLQEENNIRCEKWFHIPVAPISKAVYSETPKLQIQGVNNKKIIIHSGSVEEWSGMRIIIDCLKKGIPEDYIFLIHNRFPFSKTNSLQNELLEMSQAGYPIILHDEAFDNYNEYCTFLASFDFGIALYVMGNSPYTGKNIGEIGLASGKFATYMMVGLPTITSYSISFEALNNKYRYGANITNADELLDILRSDVLGNIEREDCMKLYTELLNPDTKLDDFIKFIVTK